VFAAAARQHPGVEVVVVNAADIRARSGRPGGGAPRTLRDAIEMVIHPLRTTDRLLDEPVWPAMLLVAGFGAVMAILFLLSHLARNYPPPPDVLETWVEAYGAFYVLPFVAIPPEQFRLAMAIVWVPLVLVVWVLMAGSARLLTLAARGSVTFDQYLVLLAFAFFPFWIAASCIDLLHSGPLDPLVLAALRGEHGPVARQVAAGFMPLAYTALYGLGGVYCAAVAARANGCSYARALAIGISSFLWPTAAGALVIR